VTEQKDRGDGHAALMDGVYRYQRHIYDLTRKYFLFGRDRLIRQLGARPGETVVEIGCGTARNLIRIARAYPEARVFGLDASREMLRTAEEKVQRAGLAGRVVLAHGFAENMTPELFGLEEPFDHAIFSYSLSMIPDWPAALSAGVRCVGRGGHVHVVDFGDFNRLWPTFARALRRWLRLYHVHPRDKLLKILEISLPRAPGSSLDILPGRYAFVLKCSPAALHELPVSPVAD
jgi:S-adenosylmethionine-diacylgycerolhomoserine-N-methlytransferase